MKLVNNIFFSFKICHKQALKTGQLPADLQIPDTEMTKAAIHDESGMMVDAASEGGDKMDTDVRNENAEPKDNDSSGNELEKNDATPIEQVFPLVLHMLGTHFQDSVSCDWQSINYHAFLSLFSR